MQSAQAAAEMSGGFGNQALPDDSFPPLIGGSGGTSSEQQQQGTSAAVTAGEFRRVCSRANLTVCAPPCNPASDGFLLSVCNRIMACCVCGVHKPCSG